MYEQVGAKSAISYYNPPHERSQKFTTTTLAKSQGRGSPVATLVLYIILQGIRTAEVKVQVVIPSESSDWRLLQKCTETDTSQTLC